MSDRTTRSLQEVFDDHLEFALQSRFDEDIEKNFSKDCIVLTGRGVFRGHVGLRELATMLEREVPAGSYQYVTRLVDGRVAFREWTAETWPFTTVQIRSSSRTARSSSRPSTTHCPYAIRRRWRTHLSSNGTTMCCGAYLFGSHLNARDVKTVSGLVKLIYPHGDVTKEELAELVQMALEGRRRVKEQLKKVGSFEYHQTSFSYIDAETRDERYVGVPEEGGRDLISPDPLAPGSLYTASVDDQGKVGLYRLEVGCSAGTGKLQLAGGADSAMRESIQRAFAYRQGHKVNMGIAQAFDTTDFHAEAIDLLINRVSCDTGMALVVAIYSALKKQAALPGLLVLGDLSIQGNIKAIRSLAEPLQVGMDNGTRRALIPIENKRNFLDVSADIIVGMT